MRSIATHGMHPASSLLASALVNYAFPLLPTDPGPEMPYEIRSLALHRSTVFAGDKSGSLACFDLSAPDKCHTVSLCDSSIDSMCAVPESQSVFGGMRPSGILAGTRSGKLYWLKPEEPSHDEFVHEEIEPAFDFNTAITCLAFAEGVGRVLVATEDGCVFVMRLENGASLQVEHSLRIGPYPISFSLPASRTKRAPLFAVTKLGAVYRLPLPPKATTGATKELEKWWEIGRTTNCMLHYSGDTSLSGRRSGVQGLFIGTNSGLSWLGWDQSARRPEILQVDLNSGQRVMSLQLLDGRSSRLSADYKAPPTLVVGIQNGGIAFLQLPKTRQSTQFASALTRNRPIHIPMDSYTYSLIAEDFGARRVPSQSSSRAFIITGTRGHKVEVFSVANRESARESIEAALDKVGDEWYRVLTELLDRNPVALDLRQALVEVLCDAMIGTIRMPAAKISNRQIQNLLLRVLRTAPEEIASLLLQRLTELRACSSSLDPEVEAATDFAEFVEKYVLGGASFSGKEICLRSLAECNNIQAQQQNTRRTMLDGLIYEALLCARSGLDLLNRLHTGSLAWSTALFRHSGRILLATSTDSGQLLIHELSQMDYGQGSRLKLRSQWEFRGARAGSQNRNYARVLESNDKALIVGLRDGRIARIALESLCTQQQDAEHRPHEPVMEFYKSSQRIPAYSLAPNPFVEGRFFIGTRKGEIFEAVDWDIRQECLWKCSEQQLDLDELDYGRRGFFAGQPYCPVWDIQAFRTSTGQQLVAAALHNSLVVLFEYSHGQLWHQDSYQLNAFANSIAYLPLNHSNSDHGLLVTGTEDGSVVALQIESTGEHLRLVPEWGLRPSDRPIRDCMLLPPALGNGVLLGCLDGNAYHIDQDGRLLGTLALGIPCNNLCSLGPSPDTSESLPIGLLAAAGEAGGEEIRLYELSPPSVWHQRLMQSLEKCAHGLGDRHHALRRAAAVRVTPNVIHSHVLADRYGLAEEKDLSSLSESSVRSAVDSLTGRIRTLIQNGCTRDLQATLVCLVRMLFGLVGHYSIADNVGYLVELASIYEDIANHWGSFGASENDEARLAAMSSLLAVIHPRTLDLILSREFGKLLAERNIHPFTSFLLTLTNHPSPQVQREILMSIGNLAERLSSASPRHVFTWRSASWIVDAMASRLSDTARTAKTLRWLDQLCCRTMVNLVESFGVSPLRLCHSLVRHGLPWRLLRRIASLSVDSTYGGLLSDFAALARAVAANKIEGVRDSLVPLQSQLSKMSHVAQEDPEELAFQKEFQALLLFLERLISIRSIGDWTTGISVPRLTTAFFSQTREVLEELESLLHQLDQYIQRPMVQRGHSNLTCRQATRSLAVKLRQNPRLGHLRQIIGVILSEWLGWLTVEQQIRLPLAVLEHFQAKSSLSSPARLQRLYKSTVRQLFTRIHHALEAEQSRLYEFYPRSSSYYMMTGDHASIQKVQEPSPAGIRSLGRAVGSHSDVNQIREVLSQHLSWDSKVMTVMFCPPRFGRVHYVMVFVHTEITHGTRALAETLQRFPTLLEAQHLLAQKLQSESQVLSMAAHQLKSPLHSFKLGLDLLASPHLSPDEADDIGEELRGRTDLFISIVSTIIESQKTGQDESPGQSRSRVTLDELIKIPVRIARQSSKSKRIHISLRIRPNRLGYAAYLNSTQITDALNALLDNAVKYSPQNGTVEVELTRSRHEAFITIEDSGIGIPANDMGDIFALYKRGQNAEEDGFDGSGIGLFVALRYVYGHGGDIHVHSEGRGRGATFTVVLPLLP